MIFLNKILSVVLSAGMIIIPTLSLGATSKTATNKATATLASSCKMSIPNVDVGDVTAQSTTLNYLSTASTINVTCSNGLAYSIGMNNGQYSTVTRLMKGATTGQFIDYSPCMVSTVTASGQCTNDYWGLDTAHMLKGTGSGITQVLPMYIIVKQGYFAPDSYSDIMTANIVF